MTAPGPDFTLEQIFGQSKSQLGRRCARGRRRSGRPAAGHAATSDHSGGGEAHLGWGYGVHVCLGMHLARLEMRTAVNLLLDRLPNLRLDPDADDPHIRGQVFRSPTSVPVLFDAQ